MHLQLYQIDELFMLAIAGGVRHLKNSCIVMFLSCQCRLTSVRLIGKKICHASAGWHPERLIAWQLSLNLQYFVEGVYLSMDDRECSIPLLDASLRWHDRFFTEPKTYLIKAIIFFKNFYDVSKRK